MALTPQFTIQTRPFNCVFRAKLLTRSNSGLGGGLEPGLTVMDAEDELVSLDCVVVTLAGHHLPPGDRLGHSGSESEVWQHQLSQTIKTLPFTVSHDIKIQ